MGILRRLAAIAYDAFLLFALFFVATALILPFTGGEAIAPGNAIYLFYLLGVSYLYFGWCWTHGGQTLGMRAWHIRVRTLQGEAVPLRLGAIRFLAALLSWGACGAGFLWAAIDPERSFLARPPLAHRARDGRVEGSIQFNRRSIHSAAARKSAVGVSAVSTGCR